MNIEQIATLDQERDSLCGCLIGGAVLNGLSHGDVASETSVPEKENRKCCK